MHSGVMGNTNSHFRAEGSLVFRVCLVDDLEKGWLFQFNQKLDSPQNWSRIAKRLNRREVVSNRFNPANAFSIFDET